MDGFDISCSVFLCSIERFIANKSFFIHQISKNTVAITFLENILSSVLLRFFGFWRELSSLDASWHRCFKASNLCFRSKFCSILQWTQCFRTAIIPSLFILCAQWYLMSFISKKRMNQTKNRFSLLCFFHSHQANLLICFEPHKQNNFDFIFKFPIYSTSIMSTFEKLHNQKQ